MEKKNFKFSSASTDLVTGASFSQLSKYSDKSASILITDEHIYDAHKTKFRGWNTIILKPGEEYKIQGTADSIIDQLIEFEADRKTTLVGIGGGVVTDITGYVAAVYMRGIRFGFVPTSVLGLVDASIGGKNGIDVKMYKNMVGVIRQPSFILHDLAFLKSLPERQWRNGFAEIIKHACIMDAAMFRELEKNDLAFYMKNKKGLSDLIRRNAMLKIKLVQKDEFENGDRKLLNFGHTLGHALENQYELMHGEAISIGMMAAAHFSRELNGFNQAARIAGILDRYGLPAYGHFDVNKIMPVLKMDKKRERKTLSYILLEKIGKAVIRNLELKTIDKFIRSLS
jgi:3-dehydroquinate synthase